MPHNELSPLLKDFILNDAQLQRLYKCFCDEVKKGLAKETQAASDIKCWITYVHDLPNGKESGQYLALDLGGTNFRVLLVELKANQEAMVKSKIYTVAKELMIGSGTQLFDYIAQCLDGFVQEHGVKDLHLPLGFTFSFPCAQLGLTKAKLTRWTKGFKCTGVEQQDVGYLLREAIAKRDSLQIDVMAILNDTTGTLMSCAQLTRECRIGLIIGTGCNACYLEHTDNVHLLEQNIKQQNSHVVINTEMGAFGDSGVIEFIRTEYDREVDNVSLNNGAQVFEKMISGMYLGELVRVVLQTAVKEKLIFFVSNNKPEILRILSNVGCFETRFISEIEADDVREFSKTKDIITKLLRMKEISIEDCQKLKYICECISIRAANLVAIALSGLINKINEQRVVVGVDGSVYRYHTKFDAYLRRTMSRFVKSNISFDLMLSEDGSGRGAALVAAVAASKQNL